MKYSRIDVCKEDMSDKHFLRIHLHNERTGTVRFDSAKEFTKQEADIRAIMFAAFFGMDCDKLPTHPEIEAYPEIESVLHKKNK